MRRKGPATPPPRPRRLTPRRLLFFVQLLAAAIGVVLYLRHEDPPAPAPPKAPTRAGAREPLPLRGPAFKWGIGTLRTYELSTVRTVRFSTDTAPTEELKLALSGRWDVTVVEASSAAVLAEVQLDELKLDLGGDAPQLERLRKSLLAPFFLEMDPSGRLRGLRLRRGTDPIVRGFLKAVAASLQYTSGAGPSWISDEIDATGEYQARYQLSVDGTRCDKGRVRYTRVAAVQGLLPVESVGTTSGELRAAFTLARTDDESARVEALTATDTLAVDAGPGMPRVSSESRVSLRLLGGAVQEDEILEQWRRLAKGPDYEPAPLGTSDEDPDSGRRSDEQLVQGARFEDLLAQLRKLPPGEDGKERASLLVRLSALMRLDPAAARRAQLAIAQVTDTQVPAARTLLGALGGAGSAAAQEALVQVGESAALSPELRMNAVAALGLSDQPEEASASALQRLASDPNADVRSTALLALGNTALAQRRQGQTGEAAAAVDELLARLSAAQTEDEQLLYLQALGNTGDPRALPALQAALRVPSVEVRKAAAQGLRFIPSDSGGTSPDQLLTEALRDPAAPVRLGALFAVSFRPLLVFLPALQQLVQNDGDEGVRSETVNLLGRALGSAGAQLLPGVLHTLKQVAEHDPAPRVRKAALDLLSGPAR